MAHDEAADGVRRKRWRSFALFFIVLIISSGLDAQNGASVPDRAEAIKRRMFVDPSSTTVSLNKVKLIVGPLTHKGKFYVGSYKLKVFPYFFKSETGTLKLEAPDEAFREFAKGTEVKFTGKATNNKTEKTKVISGKATPSDKDKGGLTFSLETNNGRMTFITSYHFTK